MASDLIVTVLPASSAMRPPNDCMTATCMLPSPTLESARPRPETGGALTASACATRSSQVAGASVKPAGPSRSVRRRIMLPLTPKGTPVRPPAIAVVSDAVSTEGNQPPCAAPIEA